MNTQLNIKTRQLLFSPSFVTLLIGIVALLVLSGPSVQAQTTATDAAAPVDSSITLAAKGSLTDATGSVTVTGNVIVSSRRVIDTTSTVTAALVLLDLDFSQVQGTTGKRVFVTGDNHATEIRPLQASDTVIVTVPYFDSTKDALSAKSMLATVTLKFDVATGKVTSGSVTIGNNVVTSAAVGTVSATPQ
jgi:hypothetical protein